MMVAVNVASKRLLSPLRPVSLMASQKTVILKYVVTFADRV